MNIKKMSKEELQNMSYADLAFALLSEKSKKMQIIDLFTEIGKLIDLSASQIEEQVADFFQILTLDKRFIMLDGGTWDLRTRHAQKLVIDEDEEEVSTDEDEEEIEDTEEDDIYYDEENDDDEADDDLKDLVIIDEDEEESML